MQPLLAKNLCGNVTSDTLNHFLPPLVEIEKDQAQEVQPATQTPVSAFKVMVKVLFLHCLQESFIGRPPCIGVVSLRIFAG